MKTSSDDHLFRSQIDDKIKRCQQKNILVCSDFLALAQQKIALQKAHSAGTSAFLWGGYEEAERKMLFLLPDYLNQKQLMRDNDCIQMLSIETKTTHLEHKDYLGSILATGIDRRCIGDIIVLKKNALVFCTQAITSYLLEHVLTIGRAHASVSLADENNISTNSNKSEEELRINVASWRLDAIIASAFSISRLKAKNHIELDHVSINGIPCSQAEKIVQVGDTLSLRRFGRVKIIESAGESRKGRFFIQITRIKH